MKTQIYNLDFLSKNRTLLMGFAIFWIFFYHQGVAISGLREFFSVGWIGVEIFFLVSGFGLCVSLTKNPDILSFYKRRLLRILPAWWFILAMMHVIGLILGVKCPHTLWEAVQWYTGLGWWIGGMNFEWYVPTLLLFYLIAPFVNKLSDKKILTGIFLFVVLGFVFHVTGILEHVYISYQRVPVFLMGFLMYRWYRKGGVNMNKYILAGLVLLGLVLFGYAYTFKDADLILSLSVRRYALLLFLIPLMYGITWIINLPDRLPLRKPLNSVATVCFTFLGAISLEIYLLHINHDFSVKVTDFLGNSMNSHSVNLLWFAIVVILAFGIHISVKFIQKRA